uniref:Uncharacterized protein n=1 Tax=Romanomermis culicivorax TaxID=13658 RepID=A0A915J4S0_ROMCU
MNKASKSIFKRKTTSGAKNLLLKSIEVQACNALFNLVSKYSHFDLEAYLTFKDYDIDFATSIWKKCFCPRLRLKQPACYISARLGLLRSKFTLWQSKSKSIHPEHWSMMLDESHVAHTRLIRNN